MPLRCGKKNVGRNIGELRRSGYPQRQAVAIAMSHMRRCASGKISRRTGRSKNRPMKGFRKCVISMLVKHFSANKTRTTSAVVNGRRSFAHIVKRCQAKYT
jgi:hypothetical protein